MPNRPPKEWFDRCVAAVSASSRVANPAAVCGAAWREKTPADKAFALTLEAPMPAKKHGKHKAKRTTKHRSKGRAKAHTKAHRSAPKRTHHKPAHHHRCPTCGHLERHDTKAGCTHFDGHRFCPCRHRHR
jgi:hypothetical protein